MRLCLPSQVHKLISTSAFMMFPGQNPGSSSRSYQAQQHGANTSSSDYSSLTNYGSGDSLRHSQSPDMGRRADHLHHLHQQQQQQHHQRTTNVTQQSHQCQQNCDCNYHSTTDFFTDSNEGNHGRYFYLLAFSAWWFFVCVFVFRFKSGMKLLNLFNCLKSMR